VALAPLGQALPETRRRGVGGQRRGADRLAEERRDGSRPGLLQGPVEGHERLLAGRVEAPGARRDVQVVGEVGAERSLQPRPAGQRQGLHRGTVVGLGGRDHLPPIRLATLHVVAAGQLDGHLDGVGPARHEADAREPLGCDLDELPRQALLGGVGEPLVVHEGQTLGLGPGGRDDVPATVPEGRRHGAAAHGVEIPAPGRVLHPDSLTTNDDRVAPIELQGQHAGPAAVDHRPEITSRSAPP